MADSSLTRVHRFRAHRRGDHSLCQPGKCVTTLVSAPEQRHVTPVTASHPTWDDAESAQESPQTESGAGDVGHRPDLASDGEGPSLVRVPTGRRNPFTLEFDEYIECDPGAAAHWDARRWKRVT